MNNIKCPSLSRWLIAMLAVTSSYARADVALIDSYTRNGSFESEQTKQTSWDTITAWTNWNSSFGGSSTSNNDSGCEPASTSWGNMIGFMQPNNAAFNLTEYVIQADDVFDIEFEMLNSSAVTVSLVYQADDGKIMAISGVTTTTDNTPGTIRKYRIKVPYYYSSVGKRVGIGIVNKGTGFPNFDNFKLTLKTSGDFYFVNAARSGQSSQDGSSWGTAFADLRDALAIASSGDEVWVAEGVYYPDEAEAGYVSVTEDSQSEEFPLYSGVSVYGGFKGDETSRDQRDEASRATILSGDIQQDDILTDGVVLSDPLNNVVGTNARTVVNVEYGEDSRSLLDGFTVTAAKSTACQGAENLRRIRFQGNLGPLYVGGGGANVTQCEFINNQSGDAGAMWVSEIGTVVDSCVFKGNSASGLGSYSTGAVRLDRGTLTIQNTVLSGNTASGCGAVLVSGSVFGASEEPLKIINCTLSGNYASGTSLGGTGAGALGVREGGSIGIYNTVVWGNYSVDDANAQGVTTFENSLVEGLNPGGTNLDGTIGGNDPLFIDAKAATSAPTSDGDYSVESSSPLRNAGGEFVPQDSHDLDEDGDVSEELPYDVRNWGRFSGIVDIGAYEFRVLNELEQFRIDNGMEFYGADDEKDWSGNGVQNILYYVFGLGDPSQVTVDNSLLPTISEEYEGYMTYSYRSHFPFNNLVPTLYTSTDLENWVRADSDLPANEAAVDVGASMEDDGYLRYNVTFPMVAPNRFYKVILRDTTAE